MLNWEDPNCKVTMHFTVRDCLWLNQWSRLANESDGLTDEHKTNLVTLCNKLEEIRSVLGSPMFVHSMFRPPRYSLLVGGSATDVHTMGIACDFNPVDFTCDDAKNILLPKLDELNIRLENNGVGADWVHIDTHNLLLGHKRYFLP